MSRRSKLLLVDDDEAFLKASSLMLRDAGYDVFTAPDGKAGLAAAREHKPDVVIALVRAIRADADLSDTKMLMLTAAGQQYQMLFEPDDLWLPVDKVLEKPLSGEELVGEIAALLGGPAGQEGRE